MKNLKILFFAIIGLIFINSCSKDDDNPQPNEQPFELNPKTIIANDNTENILTAIDSTSLTFIGNSSQIENLKVGDILASDATNIATYGYLRKITGISKNGTTTNVTTENATITEAVKSGSGEFSKTISSSDILLEDTSGVELKTTQTAGLTFDINKSFDLDNNASTTNDKIEFTGTVDLNPSLQYDIDIKDYSVEHFLAKFTFSNNAKLKVKYEFSLDQVGIHKTFVLKTIKLKPLTVWIGNFPLVLDQRIVFVVGLDGEVKAELVGEVINNYSSELGLEYYKNSGWSNIKNQSNNLSGSLALNGEASLEGWLQPRYEVRPYGLKAAKVFLAAKASLKAETSINNPTTLNASLKFIGRFFGKAQMQAFSTSLLDYEQEFWSAEHTVWTGTINYNPVDITTGLVAYYPFNGNANDESGNNNNGTINGATLTTDRHGYANKAYSFNGVSNYISINNSNSLQNISQITVGAWININNWYLSNGSGYFPIIEKSNSSSSGGIYNFHINNNSGFYCSLNGASSYSTYTPSLNTWIFVVTTISNGVSKFYVNGNLISTNSTSGSGNPISNLPLIIGADIPGFSEYANGKIDNLRIYNRALDSNEIQALYNNND